MAYKRKSWREKLEDDKGFPVVQPIDKSKSKRWGEGTFVIPAPSEVDALMKKVPEGKLITISELRGILAKRHGATIACPITTGIFAWIAAHAAAEAENEGKKKVTPYWRTLKANGELNPKYPGGIDGVKERLEAENHRVARKGRRYFVVDYEASLARLKP